jgi:hypothetical protein
LLVDSLDTPSSLAALKAPAGRREPHVREDSIPGRRPMLPRTESPSTFRARKKRSRDGLKFGELRRVVWAFRCQSGSRWSN